MTVAATALSPRGELECNSCHLLAEYKFKGKVNGKTVTTFSCCSPMCYEDARLAAGGAPHEHVPNLTFGGH